MLTYRKHVLEGYQCILKISSERSSSFVKDVHKEGIRMDELNLGFYPTGTFFKSLSSDNAANAVFILCKTYIINISLVSLMWIRDLNTGSSLNVFAITRLGSCKTDTMLPSFQYRIKNFCA